MTDPLTDPADTGERRRRADAAPLITELIDEATIQSIAEEAWQALVGEEEFLVPLPGDAPDDAVSSWVEIVGPWNGAVVLTVARSTAEELARIGRQINAILKPYADRRGQRPGQPGEAPVRVVTYGFPLRIPQAGPDS